MPIPPTWWNILNKYQATRNDGVHLSRIKCHPLVKKHIPNFEDTVFWKHGQHKSLSLLCHEPHHAFCDKSDLWLLTANEKQVESNFIVIWPGDWLWYLHWKIQFKFWWEFFFQVKGVREINPSQLAICMNLNSRCLNMVGSICFSGKISKILLDCIASLIHPQWHTAYIWLHSSHGLQHKKKRKNRFTQAAFSLMVP